MMYVCLYVCVCIIFIIVFPSTYLFYKMHKSLPIRMSEMEVIMMLWILELKGELQHGMHPKFLKELNMHDTLFLGGDCFYEPYLTSLFVLHVGADTVHSN